MAVDRRTELDRAIDCTRVGVEQQLVGIEPAPIGGIPGPVHAKSISRPNFDAGDVAVEDVEG